MSFHVNPNGDINCAFYNPSFIAHMIMDGIHENHSINFFQWSFLPFFHNGKNLISDPADGAVRDFDVVQFTHMAFNIICGHSFGIHGDDLFLHVLSDGILVFLDNLRFKLAFPVPGDVDFHVSIAGMHCLLRMSISGIIRFLVTIIILRIA